MRTDVDTTIDGRGQITLDGRGSTRLYYSHPNWQVTKTTLTIQNITLQYGAASGTGIPVAPPPCPQGTKLDGGGGAIYVRDGCASGMRFSRTIKAQRLGPMWGGLFATNSNLDFTNDSFADNIARKGLGGAIFLAGNDGSIQNATFVGNQSSGGSGYFAAAIGGWTTVNFSNTLFSGNDTRDCWSPMACTASNSGEPRGGHGAELSADRSARRGTAGQRLHCRCGRGSATLSTYARHGYRSCASGRSSRPPLGEK